MGQDTKGQRSSGIQGTGYRIETQDIGHRRSGIRDTEPQDIGTDQRYRAQDTG